MKRILLFAITFCLFASSALATPNVVVKNQLVGRGIVDTQADYLAKLFTKSSTFNTGATIKVRNSGDTADVTIATLTSSAITLGAQDVVFQSTNQVVYPVPLVITPNATFPTPVAATTPTPTYELSQQMYVVATAAPTANFVTLPVATVQPGRVYRKIWNRSGQPVAMVAQGSDTINNLSAATAFSCTTGKLCSCELTSVATNGPWMCIAQ